MLCGTPGIENRFAGHSTEFENLEQAWALSEKG
jgi:hypothetical protein